MSLQHSGFIRLVVAILLPLASLTAADTGLPDHLIPRRSSQVNDGFGINSDLPRDPFIPWNRWWWTRMFDAGVNFIRIGQYENSTDYTSWEWVERKRGEYSVVPELEDYVDSLVENHVHIEMQLLYGNPLYTGPSGKLPESVTPESGSFHNPDRSLYSVFWPPTTDEQIQAFAKYAAWMVDHFRGRVQYYEIWNEPNIEYWNPAPNPEEYGRLFKAAAAAIHRTDPNAKTVFGGLSGAETEYAKRALDACACASDIDVFAYHDYPGYGHNLNPEEVHSHGDTNASSKALRDMVQSYPGIRKGLPFWDDEFNDGLASWKGSDETVQARYVPRGLITDRATGVRTFFWLLVGATDGNELDDFGLLHGLMNKPGDFTARPVFSALQNTNTLFSDSQIDPSIEVNVKSGGSTPAAVSYAFRTASGKAIIAYWLPILSKPGHQSARRTTLQIKNSGIKNPVLVDVTSGKLTAVSWKNGGEGVLEDAPLSDGVTAVADRAFFDWAEVPEAPSDLAAKADGSGSQLTWRLHGGNPQSVSVERRAGWKGPWQQLSKLGADAESYSDTQGRENGQQVFYRVRATNAAGSSAYSNVATPAR